MEEKLKKRYRELNDEDLEEVLGGLGQPSPLYVIDGMVAGPLLENINPEDIERIEVLKDAASTAIYGARGANGVILITTNNQ